MEKPKIAAMEPIKVSLEKDKEYFFCTCGRSSNQPFCDGSHEGSSFSPKPFKVDRDREIWLCACKQTSKVPYCDGTHKCLES